MKSEFAEMFARLRSERGIALDAATLRKHSSQGFISSVYRAARKRVVDLLPKLES